MRLLLELFVAGGRRLEAAPALTTVQSQHGWLSLAARDCRTKTSANREAPQPPNVIESKYRRLFVGTVSSIGRNRFVYRGSRHGPRTVERRPALSNDPAARRVGGTADFVLPER